MKKHMIILFLILTGCSQYESRAQVAGADQEAFDKSTKDYSMTGTMHKLLATASGEWDEEISMWTGTSKEPVVNKAVCTNTMIMGGRYQQSIHKGVFNGMPFEGMSIWGFNNVTRRFESSWIDNMGTGIMFMEGRWDEKTKTATFNGKTTDPETKKEIMVREIFRFVDNNNQTMEMFEYREGKESLMMAIRFTRKQ